MKIAVFKLKIELLETKKLSSYLGSTLRGGFGCVFKKIACIVSNKECKDCILSEKCVYSYIFETPVPSNSKIMKKYTHPPQPFVIEPPLSKNLVQDFNHHNNLELGLVLIGKAIDYLPYFIYTFEEFGKDGIGKDRIKFTLDNVKCSISGNDVYNNSDKKLLQNYKVITSEDLKNEDYKIKNELTINFLTPTRIRYKEKLVSLPEFHIIIRNLLRRISLLSYFHCDEELKIDFKSLIKEAEKIKVANSKLKWYDIKRYSSRQAQEMKLGGFTGEITYKGDFKNFLEYLSIGEYVHLGKNCTFGFGKYEIKREEK